MGELELSTSFDSSLPIKDDALQTVYSRVDKVLEDFSNTHDPNAAIQAAKNLIQASRVSGLGLARLLYGMSERWRDLGMMQSFEDRISLDLGISLPTIRRYVKVWEQLYANPKIPENIKPTIASKPMGQQIRISNTAAKVELEPAEWRQIANTPNDAALKHVTNTILGKPERKNGITIRLGRKNEYGVSDITAFSGDGIRVELGYLAIDHECDSEVQIDIRARAIERIKSNSGMLEEL